MQSPYSKVAPFLRKSADRHTHTDVPQTHILIYTLALLFYCLDHESRHDRTEGKIVNTIQSVYYDQRQYKVNSFQFSDLIVKSIYFTGIDIILNDLTRFKYTHFTLFFHEQFYKNSEPNFCPKFRTIKNNEPQI